MNIEDTIKVDNAIGVVNELSPIFDMSGLNNNRPITNAELRRLRAASKVLWKTSNIKTLGYLTKTMPEIASSALTIKLGTIHESANRMIEARK